MENQTGSWDSSEFNDLGSNRVLCQGCPGLCGWRIYLVGRLMPLWKRQRMTSGEGERDSSGHCSQIVGRSGQAWPHKANHRGGAVEQAGAPIKRGAVSTVLILGSKVKGWPEEVPCVPSLRIVCKPGFSQCSLCASAKFLPLIERFQHYETKTVIHEKTPVVHICFWAWERIKWKLINFVSRG